MYHASTCLVSGKYQYFGNLNMFRSRGCIECNICDIVACKRFYTFIYIVGTLVVAMETYVAEISLYQSWFKIRYPYS